MVSKIWLEKKRGIYICHLGYITSSRSLFLVVWIRIQSSWLFDVRLCVKSGSSSKLSPNSIYIHIRWLKGSSIVVDVRPLFQHQLTTTSGRSSHAVEVVGSRHTCYVCVSRKFYVKLKYLHTFSSSKLFSN